MHVVRHQVPFQQRHALLPAQVAQDLAQLPPQLPVQHATPVFWYDHHVILALPPDVGLRFPFMHTLLLPGSRKGPSQAGQPTRAPGRWNLPASHGQRPWFQQLMTKQRLAHRQEDGAVPVVPDYRVVRRRGTLARAAREPHPPASP